MFWPRKLTTILLRYKWETLGSADFNASVGQAFRALSVPLNTTVAKGDKLGFAIGETAPYGLIWPGPFLVPWCHLEYEMEKGDDKVLFQQASGQASPRGLNANISAVVTRPGRAIKFFANVV